MARRKTFYGAAGRAVSQDTVSRDRVSRASPQRVETAWGESARWPRGTALPCRPGVTAEEAAGYEDDAGEPVRLFGVRVSDVPLDANEGTKGDTVLVVNLRVPPSYLADYELVEEGRTYREWCIPAAILNQGASVAIVAHEYE
jgi:hypothetical protein